MGQGFHLKTVENIPNQVVDPKQLGRESIIMRMDLLFNESVLAQQLQQSPCTIVTNKPIDTNLIRHFSKGIREVIYFIEEDDNPEFAEFFRRIWDRLLSVIPLVQRRFTI